MTRSVVSKPTTVITVQQIRLRPPTNGFIAFMTPATIALLTTVSTRWAAIAAITFIAVLIVRTGMLVSDNPLLTVLLGLRVRDATTSDGRSVTVLTRKSTIRPDANLTVVRLGPSTYLDRSGSTRTWPATKSHS